MSGTGPNPREPLVSSGRRGPRPSTEGSIALSWRLFRGSAGTAATVLGLQGPSGPGTLERGDFTLSSVRRAALPAPRAGTALHSGEERRLCSQPAGFEFQSCHCPAV